MLKFDSIVTGMLGVNCYLLWEDVSRRGLIIDPGGNAPDISKAIQHNSFIPEAVLLTHAHFDHIGAVPHIVQEFSIPVWCHQDDATLYYSPANNMLPWCHAVDGLPELTSKIPDILCHLGGTIIHTPGHTPGSVSFYFKAYGMLFSGDTLFCGAVGRTDFPGGSEIALQKSLREKLFVLPPNTIVYPGHEYSTTISAEMSR